MIAVENGLEEETSALLRAGADVNVIAQDSQWTGE
jgi:hypothetical protein